MTSDEKRGLYEKYEVRRKNDPAGKHINCEYFVLDLVHDVHAKTALLAYADSCALDYPDLARDLRRKYPEALALEPAPPPVPEAAPPSGLAWLALHPQHICDVRDNACLAGHPAPPPKPCLTPTLKPAGPNGDESVSDHDAPAFCVCGVRMDRHAPPPAPSEGPCRGCAGDGTLIVGGPASHDPEGREVGSQPMRFIDCPRCEGTGRATKGEG